MRVAKNARNLNDNREVEANVENYKKKKRETIKLSKINTMENTGQAWGIIYYSN